MEQFFDIDETRAETLLKSWEKPETKLSFERGYERHKERLSDSTKSEISFNFLSHFTAFEHAKNQFEIQERNAVEEDDDDDDVFKNPFDVEDQDSRSANLNFEIGEVNPNLMTGYEILNLLRTLLDMYEWEREENQVEFHEHFISTVLPKIFAKEWETEYDRILRLFKKTKHDAETILICPRRWGKTVSVAMFCAAYVLAVPNAEVAIFSTAKRTSGKMMGAVLKFMMELPLFAQGVVKKNNAECIVISVFGNDRTICCYPGTVAVCGG